MIVLWKYICSVSPVKIWYYFHPKTVLVLVHLKIYVFPATVCHTSSPTRERHKQNGNKIYQYDSNCINNNNNSKTMEKFMQPPVLPHRWLIRCNIRPLVSQCLVRWCINSYIAIALTVITITILNHQIINFLCVLFSSILLCVKKVMASNGMGIKVLFLSLMCYYHKIMACFMCKTTGQVNFIYIKIL